MTEKKYDSNAFLPFVKSESIEDNFDEFSKAKLWWNGISKTQDKSKFDSTTYDFALKTISNLEHDGHAESHSQMPLTSEVTSDFLANNKSLYECIDSFFNPDEDDFEQSESDDLVFKYYKSRALINSESIVGGVFYLAGIELGIKYITPILESTDGNSILPTVTGLTAGIFSTYVVRKLLSKIK